MKSAVALLVSAALALSGCAEPTQEEGIEQAEANFDASGREPGISTTATYRLYFNHIPNISGPDPKGFRLVVSVVLEDSVLRKSHPGFDGYERVFSLIPRHTADGTRYERLDLKYESTTGGAWNCCTFDRHRAELQMTSEDLPVLEADGIAIGLETNVGTVWAQAPGRNFTVTEQRF